jgi:hypothetical protein
MRGRRTEQARPLKEISRKKIQRWCTAIRQEPLSSSASHAQAQQILPRNFAAAQGQQIPVRNIKSNQKLWAARIRPADVASGKNVRVNPITQANQHGEIQLPHTHIADEKRERTNQADLTEIWRTNHGKQISSRLGRKI